MDWIKVENKKPESFKNLLLAYLFDDGSSSLGFGFMDDDGNFTAEISSLEQPTYWIYAKDLEPKK